MADAASEEMDGAEGIAGLALAAIASDGVIEQSEIEALATSLSRMQLFNTGADQVQKALERAIAGLQAATDLDSFARESALRLPEDLKPTAFVLVVDLLMADGRVADEEKAFLKVVQKALGVKDALARNVIEVLSIKNHG